MLTIYKKYELAEHERGLLLQNGRLVAVLDCGIHRFLLRPGRLNLVRFDVSAPEFQHRRGDLILRRHPELAARHFQIVELGDREIGLVHIDGRLVDVIAPGATRIYWKEPYDVQVERRSLIEDFAVPPATLTRLARLERLRTGGALDDHVLHVEIPEQYVALLYVNGRIERILDPGEHGFFRSGRTLQVVPVDQRLQVLEVSGQEILTRDKIALRINLTAIYRIADPRRAHTGLASLNDTLYKELQLGLREAVGTRDLEQILAEKDAVNEIMREHARARIGEHGIELESVGIKDIILPGEVKAILQQVVEAEKAAQANLIRRREETAATRSLHNTAKMMEGNPVLLRLKELEILERVTERIDRLTVFNGLDGVLDRLVNLTPRQPI